MQKSKERSGVAAAFRRLQSSHTKSSQQRVSPVKQPRQRSVRDHVAFGSILSTKNARGARSPSRRSTWTSAQHDNHHGDGSSQLVEDHNLIESRGTPKKMFSVNVAFRIIDRSASDQSPFISHSPVEQCLVYGEKNVYADALFPASATVEQVGSALVPPILHSAMNGQPSVVAAYGGALTGKSSTMFGEGGVFPSYVMQLLHELQRMGLSQLWAVKCSVVEIVGDTLYDRLDEMDDERVATYRHGIRALVVEDLQCLQNIATRLPVVGGETSGASHVIVSVYVEPVLPEEGVARHLMRSLGNVHFVECCDKIGVDSNLRTVQQIKMGGVAFLNVIGALVRRSFSTPSHTNNETSSQEGASKESYVPYQDSSLTAYLQPDLDIGKTWLLLHVDNSSAPSDACRSTVDIGMRISREKFPQGLPDPDYRAIAHREYQRGQSLTARFAQEREAWLKEKEDLLTELGLVQQAFEASLATGKSERAPETNVASPNVNEVEDLRNRIHDLESENASLRTALNRKNSGHNHDSKEGLKEALTLLQSTVTKLQHHALCDPQLPSPSIPQQKAAENETEVLLGAELCLLQLTHQLCEREKAIATLLKRDSSEKGTSCLHWQSWRRCLADLHEPLALAAKLKNIRSAAEVATRPHHRTSFQSGVFCLFNTSFETMSTGFHSYWTLPQPFPSAPSERSIVSVPVASPSPAKSPRTGFTAEAVPQTVHEVSSPPSRLEHLLLEKF